MQKVCTKVVPKTLIIEQIEARKTVCTDNLDAISNDPDFLESENVTHHGISLTILEQNVHPWIVRV